MTVHLIHGIHTAGANWLQSLALYLAPRTVKYPDYGYIWGVETKVVNPLVAGALKPYIGPNDVIIGHSNGCAIAYDIMMQGTAVAGAVFINAALETDIALPSKCPWIRVYFNPGDDITEAAAVAQRLGIVDKVWGEMGHSGYTGTNPKITDTNCGATPGLPVVSGHSDFGNHLAAWGPYLAADLAFLGV